MFDHGLDLFSAVDGVAGSLLVIKDSVARLLSAESAIPGRVLLLESMLADTGEFVGLILNLATRLRALETSASSGAGGGVSGAGVHELELRLARVERDLTEEKPFTSPPSSWEGVAQEALLERLAILLEASIVDDVDPAFKIGGRAFRWLASKAPGLIDYLGHWVDPFSMSSFAEAQTHDANAKLVHKRMLTKANFNGGSNEASVLFPFSDVLPLLVGSSHLVVDTKFMLPK
jgi:hypothetical protein